MNCHSRKHFSSPNAANTSPVNFNFRRKTHLSARKLAARLWHLRFFQIQSSLPRVKREEEEVVAKRARKLLRETKLIGDDSVLLSELLRAQTFINKLKAQRKSFQDYFYEQNLCKGRELHKNQAMLEELKDKLARERRSRERMESLNAKLVNELAQVKLYAKQFMINYKEERRKREMMEELCNELAMQVGEDKAKIEEMEQERNMFHMVELWRQESIQMKLLDAKLALEDKYNQMINLIALLQSFLRSRGDELPTLDAQFIKQAAESVNVELSCDITDQSNDVFSIFERGIGVELEPHYPPSSTVNIVSLDEDCCLNNNSVLHQLSTSLDNVRLGTEAECCENAEDASYEHCDSVAQQNSYDSTFDKCEGRVIKSSVQSGGIGSSFMCKGSGESGFRECELFGQRNFADSVNPHITRGMKGCIEWPRPRGIPKINSKVVIPLEERVRKQKSQLQHILKPLA